MSTKSTNSSIILGFAVTALAAGIWVGGQTGAISLKYYVYEFEKLDANNNKIVKKGFACICQKLPNQPSRWLGKAPSDCGPGTDNDVAIPITEVPFPHPLIPAHVHGTNIATTPADACCRDKPRAPGMNIFVPNGDACMG